VDPDDRYCGKCGHDLTAAPPRAEPPAGAGSGPDATDSFVLAPPLPVSGDETLALGIVARLSDPHEGDPHESDPQGQDPHGQDPNGQDPHNRNAQGRNAGESDPRAGHAAGRQATGHDPVAQPEAGAVCVACGLGGVDQDGYCEHCGHAQPRQRDHQEQELEGVAAVSDRGLRHHRNEDAFALATTSLPDGTPAVATVVCDGVSTAYRPDDASAAAAVAGSESLLAALERGTEPDEAMRGALLAAFDAVGALADEEPPQAGAHHNSPACTCVSAVITGPVFTVGWIGDSRAYWIPDDRGAPAARLTEDDSWAARMVAHGLMSHAEAYADERAHAITGWLGADAVEVDPHVAAFRPESPGVIVVCTDGLWNYAESADEMAEAVPADARVRPLASARTLLGVALDGGGHDNVTVAVLPFPAAVSRAGFPPA
jgi:serine/threonine protein phosphatase PrpC